MENFEDKYLDVLQNIEFGIMAVYQQQPELVDFDVEKALDWLLKHYTAEMQNRPSTPVSLSARPMDVYTSVQSMCDWRLGKAEIFQVANDKSKLKLPPHPNPVTVSEIIACLKRIKKSVQTWNKRGGRRGYLDFAAQYVR